MRIDAARKFIALPLLLLGLLLCAHARDAHAAQLAQLARAGLPGARAYFEQAVQLRPEDGEARAGLAIALVFSGKEADARYQVQRMDDAGAQGPAARLARGLMLGLAGNADSQYQFSRAEEEGADRALALLCRATVAAARKPDYEAGHTLMTAYAALVPEADRSAFAKALDQRLDIKARLAGRYRHVWIEGYSSGIVIDFEAKNGVLAATPSGGGGGNTPMSITGVVLRGHTLDFRYNYRTGGFGLGGEAAWNFTCDISGDLSVMPCAYKTVAGSTHRGHLVRQATAQP